ncbi:MAG: hypothetical protein B0D91_13045 [Oceanospirillales bacterium LUC14_002_19_P2]|nr:MAG: hypothetical protein B0D91_13045 [Oceanospirillales bacterium LUC14_002_19_P2]
MREGLKKLAVALAFGAVSSGAIAAQDGPLHPSTSAGNFDVTLVNAAGVRIWGLQDIVFDTQGASANQTSTVDICVFSNGASGATEVQYKIDAATSSATLSNGASPATELDYRVEFADADNAFVDLITGGSVQAQVSNQNAGTLASQPDPTLACTSDQNAQLRVSVLGTDIGTAGQGVYTGNVVLTVTPQ